jgi:hypothetical protein
LKVVRHYLSTATTYYYHNFCCTRSWLRAPGRVASLARALGVCRQCACWVSWRAVPGWGSIVSSFQNSPRTRGTSKSVCWYGLPLGQWYGQSRRLKGNLPSWLRNRAQRGTGWLPHAAGHSGTHRACPRARVAGLRARRAPRASCAVVVHALRTGSGRCGVCAVPYELRIARWLHFVRRRTAGGGGRLYLPRALRASPSLRPPLYKLRGAAAVGPRRPLHAAGGPAWCVGVQQPPPRPCGAAQGLLHSRGTFFQTALLQERARRWRARHPLYRRDAGAARLFSSTARDAGAAAPPLSPRRWRGGHLYRRNAGAARLLSTSAHDTGAPTQHPSILGRRRAVRLLLLPLGARTRPPLPPSFPSLLSSFHLAGPPAKPVDPGMVVIGTSVSHFVRHSIRFNGTQLVR